MTLKANITYITIIAIAAAQVGCAAPEYKVVNQQVVKVKEGEIIGVEGEMGAIMHKCLATNQTGPSIPLVVTGKDILPDQRSEHEDYFDCVDEEIMKSEQK